MKGVKLLPVIAFFFSLPSAIVLWALKQQWDFDGKLLAKDVECCVAAVSAAEGFAQGAFEALTTVLGEVTSGSPEVQKGMTVDAPTLNKIKSVLANRSRISDSGFRQHINYLKMASNDRETRAVVHLLYLAVRDLELVFSSPELGFQKFSEKALHCLQESYRAIDSLQIICLRRQKQHSPWNWLCRRVRVSRR